ncbi:SpdD-like protein [Streptomyces sp. NPDC056656]|uniref:SpdD-like protein n=1 Tax=Streptomyces sp. NPDC056656 TaxID=3345895 RepID=UPI0036C688B2
MFRPRIPVNDTPTGQIIPIITTAAPGSSLDQVPHLGHATSYCFCENRAPAAAARPAVQLTPGALALVVAGGTAAVLVVGAVLVSMLLAVAITGVSLAICALVVRSLIRTDAKRR